MKTTQRFLLPVTLLGLITCLAVGVRAQQDEKPATGDGPAAAAKPTVAVSDAEARIAEQLFQEGRKLFFQGKHLESIAKLKKAAETNRSRTGYKLLLAKAHRAVKQDAAATAVLEEIIKANADHVEAGVQLAELLDPTKKPERVIAIVEPLLRLKHTYDLYHLLAEAYYHQEDFNSARKNFEAAVKLNPRNRTDHYQLGNIYLSQKRFARAARSYQTARELGFSSGVFHFKLASVYFNLHNYLGRISTATILGGKAGEVSGDLYLIDSVPGKTDTFHVAGPRSAVYHVAMARELGIDVFEIQFLEANVWLSAHYFDKADAIYGSLKEKVAKEDSALFWSQWAQTALGQDDFDNYIGRLKKAIEIAPEIYKATLSDALTNVAKRYQQRGDNKNHIAFLKQAVDENPLSARLHVTLGDSYWSLNDRDNAMAQYKLVLELEPGFADKVRLQNRIRGAGDPVPTTAATVATQPGLTGVASLPPKDVTCLFSGDPAKKEFTMKYKGGNVFFCCKSCRDEFTSNLTQNSAKANHQLFKTGQASVKTCPVSGRKLNPKFNAQVAGVTVPLCCGGCKSKVEKEKDVEKKVELVFNNIIFSKHYTIGPAGR
jgi:tetratricopeptide (TPR) repeat protein